MAAIYSHKSRGYQIVFTIYFPNGERSKPKYRFRQTRTEADELFRLADILEKGSRRGDLNQREITAGRHADLLTEDEARKLAGGKPVEAYDLDRICQLYEVSSALANTATGHELNMGRMRRWKAWLQENPLTSLQVSDLESYLKHRRDGEARYENAITHYSKKGVAAKTLRNDLEVLRGMIDKAVDKGMVGENIARKVSIPWKNKRLRRAFSSKETHTVMEQAQKMRHLCRGYIYPVTMTFFYTGMRLSEVRTLNRYEDLRLDLRKIFIQAKDVSGEDAFTPKNGEAAWVYIPDKLYEVLSTMPDEGPFLFGGKTPISKNSLYQGFKKLVITGGLDPKLTIHFARHTFTSRLLQISGGDLKYTQQRSRHKDVETLKNYLHVIESPTDILEKDLDF